MLPARSVEFALSVSVPSPSAATFSPETVIVPAPAVPARVVMTLLPPFETVSLTLSVVSEPAGRVIVIERLAALPELT